MDDIFNMKGKISFPKGEEQSIQKTWNKTILIVSGYRLVKPLIIRTIYISTSIVVILFHNIVSARNDRR